MATITPTRVSQDIQLWDTHVDIFTWAAIPQSSTGSPISGASWADRSFQIEGNFNGATVTLTGSNDGINYHTLHDPFNNLLSFTSTALAQITEITLYIQPVVGGGGASTNLNATVLVCNHAAS